jgi:pimeloyl-ACP methyl ester carboxylesterase
MPTFINNNISLHYEIHGTGSPVLLLHGAAVSFKYNYAQFGWIEELTNQGFQVIGLDFRGHGESDKPVDSDSYGTINLSNDVIALIKHLKFDKVSLVAYSIGTAIALNLLHTNPKYFSKSVLMATGDGLLGFPPFILDTMLPGLAQVFSFEKLPADLPAHVAAYWNFTNEIGAKKESMIALASAKYPHLSVEDAATIDIPTLVISGEQDVVLGTGERLAQSLTNGHYLEIPDADHLTLASDSRTRVAAIDFLKK